MSTGRKKVKDVIGGSTTKSVIEMRRSMGGVTYGGVTASTVKPVVLDDNKRKILEDKLGDVNSEVKDLAVKWVERNYSLLSLTDADFAGGGSEYLRDVAFMGAHAGTTLNSNNGVAIIQRLSELSEGSVPANVEPTGNPNPNQILVGDKQGAPSVAPFHPAEGGRVAAVESAKTLSDEMAKNWYQHFRRGTVEAVLRSNPAMREIAYRNPTAFLTAVSYALSATSPRTNVAENILSAVSAVNFFSMTALKTAEAHPEVIRSWAAKHGIDYSDVTDAMRIMAISEAIASPNTPDELKTAQAVLDTFNKKFNEAYQGTSKIVSNVKGDVLFERPNDWGDEKIFSDRGDEKVQIVSRGGGDSYVVTTNDTVYRYNTDTKTLELVADEAVRTKVIEVRDALAGLRSERSGLSPFILDEDDLIRTALAKTKTKPTTRIELENVIISYIDELIANVNKSTPEGAAEVERLNALREGAIHSVRTRTQSVTLSGVRDVPSVVPFTESQYGTIMSFGTNYQKALYANLVAMTVQNAGDLDSVVNDTPLGIDYNRDENVAKLVNRVEKFAAGELRDGDAYVTHVVRNVNRFADLFFGTEDDKTLHFFHNTFGLTSKFNPSYPSKWVIDTFFGGAVHALFNDIYNPNREVLSVDTDSAGVRLGSKAKAEVVYNKIYQPLGYGVLYDNTQGRFVLYDLLDENERRVYSELAGKRQHLKDNDVATRFNFTEDGATYVRNLRRRQLRLSGGRGLSETTGVRTSPLSKLKMVGAKIYSVLPITKGRDFLSEEKAKKIIEGQINGIDSYMNATEFSTHELSLDTGETVRYATLRYDESIKDMYDTDKGAVAVRRSETNKAPKEGKPRVENVSNRRIFVVEGAAESVFNKLGANAGDIILDGSNGMVFEVVADEAGTKTLTENDTFNIHNLLLRAINNGQNLRRDNAPLSILFSAIGMLKSYIPYYRDWSLVYGEGHEVKVTAGDTTRVVRLSPEEQGRLQNADLVQDNKMWSEEVKSGDPIREHTVRRIVGVDEEGRVIEEQRPSVELQRESAETHGNVWCRIRNANLRVK